MGIYSIAEGFFHLCESIQSVLFWLRRSRTDLLGGLLIAGNHVHQLDVYVSSSYTNNTVLIILKLTRTVAGKAKWFLR